MIYFVAAAELERVKIGVASDPWKRLSKMQSDSPCELTMLAIIEGDETDERALHQKFSSDRLNGEWFVFSDALRSLVRGLPKAEKPKREAFTTAVAKGAGISMAHASLVLRGKTKCSARVALDIERASAGRIDAGQLCKTIAEARKGIAA